MADRMVRSGSFRSYGGRAQKRQTEWLGSADQTAITALPAASFIFDQSLTTAELAKRPFTITRTVGSIWVRSDQVAAREDPFGAVGFQVVSEKAVATGVTAIPDPISQEASDTWFTYAQWASEADTLRGSPLVEYKFDSRGQRKVEDGFDIAVVVANASAAFGASYILKFRLLIKVA